MSNVSFRRQQHGFAMLAIVALVALVSMYVIVNAFSRTNGEIAIDRDQRTMKTLTEAKAALIAWAANVNSTQPGALPCPDRNTTSLTIGGAMGSCSSAATRVGRLPWKTIGFADLRDASGEHLWYAVSANFVKSAANVINSETQGQLTVTGVAPANNIVAVVIAPGTAVGTQIRDNSYSDPSIFNSVANYLENANASATDIYTTAAQPSSTFNDQLIVITQADLMATVEPVVAARIESDIKPYLATYFTEWNAFPFPSRFDNPDPGTNNPGSTRVQSAYAGDATQTGGLLPITASASYSWTGGSGISTILGLPITGSCSAIPDTAPSGPGWQCNFLSVTLSPIISSQVTVQGTLDSSAGLSFAKLPNTTDVVAQKTGVGTLVVSSPTIQGALTSTGTGTVTYSATLLGTCVLCTIKITIPDVVASPITSNDSAGNPTSAWFIINEWYRQTYYAVSPGYLPGGGAACNPLPATPSCLTVNNMPGYYAAPNTDKRAILVLAGRALNSAVRPSPNLANYFEGQNPTPGDFIYEHRAGVPTSINDKVVVVCPDPVLCP